jgi:hypothetical protein
MFGSFDYGFDFVLAGVPEPASNAGLLTALLFLQRSAVSP